MISLKDLSQARNIIYQNKEELLKKANSKARTVRAIDLRTRVLNDKVPISQNPMLIVELIVDTKDAMGANAINTMCELVSPKIESLTKGKVILKILSNYATERIATCETTLRKEHVGGDESSRKDATWFCFCLLRSLQSCHS